MAEIQVRGLREVQSAFRKVDKELPKAFKQEFLGIAQKVVGGVQQKVPKVTGAAAGSVRPRATQRGAGIAFGGNAAPYFPWLDFGGTTGKGHRPGAAQLDDTVVDFPGQQPQGQADHARGMAQHPLDGQVGLSGIGGPQNRDEPRRRLTCGPITHSLDLGQDSTENWSFITP